MTRAVLQVVATPEAVDAPLGEVPSPPEPPVWRRHGWLLGAVPAAAVIVVQRAVPPEDLPLRPAVLSAILGVFLLVTVVLGLVRYRDDRAAVSWLRGTAALRTDTHGTTGSFVRASASERRGRVLFTGQVMWSDGGVPDVVRVTHEDAVDTPLPRRDDPVALWPAPGGELVVLRYHRGWADDVLDARD
ncbi:hypothetical protein [Oerskovia flava]|uniref:hypothetical protein n=1 Tax=Oerskovia flava TaxID=2986422 RepID=UPI00223EC83F|nr:hypothetical protein [Oerskovia sp. JB1-3-2]